MPTRRLLEVLGMLMVGEGVLMLLYPRRHLALWEGGPWWYREAVEGFIRYPNLTRAVGGLEAGLGLWLATRQMPR